MAKAQCLLKIQTAETGTETGTEIQFPTEFSNMYSYLPKVGREQLKIYFNITNVLISVEFSA